MGGRLILRILLRITVFMTFPRLKSALAVSLGAVAGALSRYYLGGMADLHQWGLNPFRLEPWGSTFWDVFSWEYSSP